MTTLPPLEHAHVLAWLKGDTWVSRQNLLFAKRDLLSVITAHHEAVGREVAGIDPDGLLNTSVDDLVKYLYEKFRLDVPELQESGITVDQRETQLDVSNDSMRFIRDRSRPFYIPATEVRYFVPFTGDPDLFLYQASTFSMNPPRGEITRDQHLVLSYILTGHDPNGVRSQFQSNIARINEHLDWARKDVAPFNASLPSQAREAIEKRRQKLLDDRGLLAGLGFPLRERPGTSQTYVTPTVRRRPLPTRPPVAKATPYVPEPALEMGEYERILSIMRNMVTVMERSPKAFRTTDEEGIRQHFLVQLNAVYEGQAGETFNYEGKTDILIRVDGRNIFIAECKLWSGPKSLRGAIDQLLGYTTWRDTKTAVLVFNRARNFSRVVEQLAEVVQAHPNFKRAMPYDQEAGFRAILSNRDDPDRELILTVLAFDIPN